MKRFFVDRIPLGFICQMNNIFLAKIYDRLIAFSQYQSLILMYSINKKLGIVEFRVGDSV